MQELQIYRDGGHGIDFGFGFNHENALLGFVLDGRVDLLFGNLFCAFYMNN